MRQELIPLSDRDRWCEALHGISHTFGHTWENCHAMSLSSDYQTFLYRFVSDGVRIVCPIAERWYAGERDIVTPFGFSGFVSFGQSIKFSQAWLGFARERE